MTGCPAAAQAPAQVSRVAGDSGGTATAPPPRWSARRRGRQWA